MPGVGVQDYLYDDDMIDAARRDGATRVRVFRLRDTAVVLGCGSRPETELNIDACVEDGVRVMRRRGGGCAVVLDPSTVIVSVVKTGVPFGHQQKYFDALSDWLIEGLARIGIRGVGQAGICDLVLGGKKVAGACLYRSRDLLYYSASILAAVDTDKISRYLKHPPREPQYRGGRPHVSFLGSLEAYTSDTCAKTVATGLRRVLEPPVLDKDYRSRYAVQIAHAELRKYIT